MYLSCSAILSLVSVFERCWKCLNSVVRNLNYYTFDKDISHTFDMDIRISYQANEQFQSCGNERYIIKQIQCLNLKDVPASF